MSARASAAIALLVAIAPLGVVAMMTNDSLRIRQLEQRIAANVQSSERFVDIGVRLSVVEAHPDGKELVQGAPLLRVIGKPRLFGGLLDTRSNPPRIIAPSQKPRDWYCSREQWNIVRHADDEPIGKLAVGGMGAGKTTAGVMWLYLRWLEAIDLGETDRRQIGVTAPTEKRMLLVLDELKKLFPSSWYRFSTATNIVTLCEGTTLRFVSTKRQSAAAGSPLQGFNWSGWLADELQDQLEEFIHAVARLRSGVNGRAKRLGTATAKDDPAWRTFKQAREDAGDWKFHQMLGTDSPFIHPAHWRSMAAGMSSNQYKRLVLAQDLPSELAVYPAWSRDTNLIVVPEIGWTDVTENELKIYGPQRAELVGHDPGTLWDVSLRLRAYVRNEHYQTYMRGKARPFWVVRGEINTEQSTTEHHISRLLATVRPLHLNLLTRDGKPNPHGRQILVRADPSTTKENGTDKSIYTQFSNAGIHIKPAAYNANNDGHGRVPKDAGIELINTLFCAESGERRLFVERRADNTIAAPKLVAALESSERDDSGRAEADRKGPNDVSHWCAALRYALWAIERPRLRLLTQEES